MKTSKEIIGYRLKKESKHINAVSLITGALREIMKANLKTKNYHISSKGLACEELKELGLLELWFTPVYKEEPELEVGRWYKYDLEDAKSIFYCTAIDDTGHLYGYGIFNGEWREYKPDCRYSCASNNISAQKLTPATDQEVEAALIKEAEKRGFNYKQYGEELSKRPYYEPVKSDKNFGGKGRLGCDIYYSKSKGELMNTGLGLFCIFKDGQWAEIIPETYEITLPKSLEGKVTINYK